MNSSKRERKGDMCMLKLGHLAALYARQRNPRLLDGCQPASVPTAETNLPDLSYSRSERNHAIAYTQNQKIISIHLHNNAASIKRCSDYVASNIKSKFVKLTSVSLSLHLNTTFLLKRNWLSKLTNEFIITPVIYDKSEILDTYKSNQLKICLTGMLKCIIIRKYWKLIIFSRINILIYSSSCFRSKTTFMTGIIRLARISSDNYPRLSLFQSRNQIKMRKSGERPSNFIGVKRVEWCRSSTSFLRPDLSEITIWNYKILNQIYARKLANENDVVEISLDLEWHFAG